MNRNLLQWKNSEGYFMVDGKPIEKPEGCCDVCEEDQHVRAVYHTEFAKYYICPSCAMDFQVTLLVLSLKNGK